MTLRTWAKKLWLKQSTQPEPRSIQTDKHDDLRRKITHAPIICSAEHAARRALAAAPISTEGRAGSQFNQPKAQKR